MKKNRDTSSHDLQSGAEELEKQRLRRLEHLPKDKLKQELSVHQVELEAQNAQLRATQLRLEDALDTYTCLYHKSPVGYVTIDDQGIIRDLNESFATMCQHSVETIKRRNLAEYLTSESRAIFTHRLRPFYKKPQGKKLEVCLNVPSRIPLWVEIVGQHLPGKQGGHLACNVIDISEQKEFEKIRHRLDDELTKNYILLSNERIKLEKLNLTLESRVKTATQDLVAANLKIRSLSATMEKIREKERKDLAQSLHDGIGQVLVAMKFELQSLRRSKSTTDAQASLALLEQDICSVINKVRSVTTDLRPSVFDNLGLLEALQWKAKDFSDRSGLPCLVDCCTDLMQLSEDHQIALFRIVEEALTNILKHAAADQVEITCRGSFARGLTFSITDNGKGLALQHEDSASYGMIGMRERAKYIGGELKLVSQPLGGTTVEIRLPAREK